MMPLALSESYLFGLPLVEIWFVVMFLTLAMFLWLDGSNFGIGVLFGLVDDEEIEESMLAAVAPLWDGTEVWLIVFGGAMFAVFPDVYAGLFSENYMLMFLILGALIIRGVSPEFREQRHDETWQRVFGGLFVAGSVLAPLFLGMFTANWLVGSTDLFTVPGIVVGLAVVALATVEGAAFTNMKIEQPTGEITTYGTLAQVAYLVLAVTTVAYLYLFVAGMATKVMSEFSLALVGLTAVLGVAYIVMLRSGQALYAFVMAGVQTFGLVALVGYLLYPTIYPITGLTAQKAAVSELAMNLMTVVLAIFLPLVLMYFAVLYNAFRGPVQVGEGY
ncbi:cytochrome d ubiquinol oxidase subunit II [Halanaeroarchaeum sulfurireducens]|uniref:Cytochrome bd quinol oxidase subunit 2 n=1 Tax=Halanaeroarchaeum sulfurireducens TaxID=1604004 RepID=A0A0N9N3P9_9EURY|nr:cytochrome d ubiquinol oxidase subunit II [Halanaeroarchaeum sulfurireducens]ALG82349.1 cytochrome bd quinol oxidase subunit 2 [Halanaeroarchaeum sulfurireducens]